MLELLRRVVRGDASLQELSDWLSRNELGPLSQEELEWLYYVFVRRGSEMGEELYLEVATLLVSGLRASELVSLVGTLLGDVSYSRDRVDGFVVAVVMRICFERGLEVSAEDLVRLLCLGATLPAWLRSVLEVELLRRNPGLLGSVSELTSVGREAVNWLRRGVSPRVVLEMSLGNLEV